MMLPSGLKDIINEGGLVENKIGESGSKVYKVDFEGEGYYLKINTIDMWGNLKREKEVYEYLKGTIEVPRVIYYERVENIEYLLISEVKGTILSVEAMKAHPKNVVQIMASALKKLHQIPIDNCLLDSSTSALLEEGKYRVDNNLVDIDDFEEQYRDKTPVEILKYLIKNKPLKEEKVFIHGDYCLPNIIALNGEFSGFIDMGNGGIGDKYRDIALALRSIEHNFMDRKLWSYFKECYGEKNLDMDKVDYHILLDELF